MSNYGEIQPLPRGLLSKQDKVEVFFLLHDKPSIIPDASTRSFAMCVATALDQRFGPLWMSYYDKEVAEVVEVPISRFYDENTKTRFADTRYVVNEMFNHPDVNDPQDARRIIAQCMQPYWSQFWKGMGKGKTKWEQLDMVLGHQQAKWVGAQLVRSLLNESRAPFLAPASQVIEESEKVALGSSSEETEQRYRQLLEQLVEQIRDNGFPGALLGSLILQGEAMVPPDRFYKISKVISRVIDGSRRMNIADAPQKVGKLIRGLFGKSPPALHAEGWVKEASGDPQGTSSASGIVAAASVGIALGAVLRKQW